MQGFEGNVLEGGRNVLLHRKIPHILTEVGPAMLRAANSDATAYLQEFVEARRRRCFFISNHAMTDEPAACAL